MGGGGEEWVHMSLVWMSKMVISHFEELGHVPVCIQLIFMSFIAISSSLMSYFKVMLLAGILPQQSLFKRCHTHLNIIKTTAGINMISVQAMNLRSPCWCVCTFWIAVWADLQTKITRMMLSSSIAQWSEHRTPSKTCEIWNSDLFLCPKILWNDECTKISDNGHFS